MNIATVRRPHESNARQTIVKGKSKMPSFDKKVTSDQLQALVAHIRSLGK
jgi:hypothetical protein